MKVLWIVDDIISRNLIRKHGKLRRNYPEASLVILAIDSLSAEVLARHGIPYKTYGDYVLPASQRYSAATAGMQMLERIESLELPRGSTIRSLTLHSGISLWDLHRVDLLVYGFERMVSQMEFARSILEMERPDRIYCDAAIGPLVTFKGFQYDRLLCRLILCMAAERSIKCICGNAKGRLRTRLIAVLIPLLSVVKTFLIKLRLTRLHSSNKAASDTVDILALNHTVRNAEALIPVLKRLGQEGRWRNVVLQIGPQGEEDLQGARLPYCRWEGYLTLSGSLRVFATTISLFWGWRCFRNGMNRSSTRRQVFSHGGGNLWEVAEEGVQFFWMTLAQGARNLEIARRAIEVRQPKLIVGTNERSGTFRAFYQMGRNIGIRSLCIYHGIVDLHPLWRFPIGTDVMTVEGRAAVDNLARVGWVSSSTLVMTSQPKYDDLLQRSPERARERIFGQFGIPAGYRLVVYASAATREVRWKGGKVLGSEDAAYAGEAEAIYKAVSQINGCYLVVKPHPQNDDPSMHRELLQKLGTRNLFIAEAESDIYSFILASDLLITRWSQTGVDALVFGKALVIVNLTGEEDIIPYVKFGAALGAYSVQDVAPAIESALHDPTVRTKLELGRKEFLAYQTAGMDGNASGRVALVIDAMMEGRGPTATGSCHTGIQLASCA